MRLMHVDRKMKMIPEHRFTDEDIQKRFETFYGDSRSFTEGQIPYLREKLSSLSEFVREIKVGFARYYNRRHDRRGYFWEERFKSVIVDKGETLVNCFAYIDLNPLRADPMLLSWYQGKTGESYPNLECGPGDKPAWIVYAESRGGDLTIDINEGQYVFVYLSI
jgi:hypothetical protein